MGMFDSIYVRCPECGVEHEFQSKAGDCYLHRYSLDDAPPQVLGDLHGDTRQCKCGAMLKILVQTLASVAVVREEPQT
jgi:hypothetical protein